MSPKTINGKRTAPYRMWISSRQRARQHGWEHCLDVEDIVVPDVCPILGIKLIRNAGCQTPNSPSIHRVDSTKGYTVENIIIISWRANDLIKNATFEECAQIFKWWSAHIDSHQSHQ